MLRRIIEWLGLVNKAPAFPCDLESCCGCGPKVRTPTISQEMVERIERLDARVRTLEMIAMNIGRRER